MTRFNNPLHPSFLMLIFAAALSATHAHAGPGRGYQSQASTAQRTLLLPSNDCKKTSVQLARGSGKLAR